MHLCKKQRRIVLHLHFLTLYSVKYIFHSLPLNSGPSLAGSNIKIPYQTLPKTTLLFVQYCFRIAIAGRVGTKTIFREVKGMGESDRWLHHKIEATKPSWRGGSASSLGDLPTLLKVGQGARRDTRKWNGDKIKCIEWISLIQDWSQ